MTSTTWADLNRDGRRMESLIKQMNTKQKKEKVMSLKFSYINTMIKATVVKVGIAETVLNVNAILKEAKKQGLEPIIAT